MKSNQKEDSITKKNNKVKWWIDTILNIIILILLLYYFIHIKFGIGMKKVNIEVTTDCETGNIKAIKGNDTAYDFTRVQETIWQEMNKTRGEQYGNNT